MGAIGCAGKVLVRSCGGAVKQVDKSWLFLDVFLSLPRVRIPRWFYSVPQVSRKS